MNHEITLTSDITVELMQKMGGDEMISAAALASTKGAMAKRLAENPRDPAMEGRINYLMKQRHGTPSEHSALTMFVHAPMFVWWEWIRHRVGQTISVPGLSDDMPDMSFNLESGRYKVLEPVFWIPRKDRPMVTAKDHKAARPKFVTLIDAAQAVYADPTSGTPGLYAEGWYRETIDRKRCAYEAAWKSYCDDIADGIANEVARVVLGTGIYYSGWVTCNPRSLMSFISLRTHDPEAKFVSYPQREIEEGARAAESILEEFWPVSYEKFCKNGRVGP